MLSYTRYRFRRSDFVRVRFGHTAWWLCRVLPGHSPRSRTGFADNLLSRAAHVTLKERRPLVLVVVREAPFSRPMLQNMLAAFDAGAAIMPASPGFYHRPETVDELVGTVTARTLDLLRLENMRSPRWKE